MDLGPSILRMAGAEPPAYMDGRPLLCKGNVEDRPYVIGVRDRIDTRFEMCRSVRDKRYRYQRNFYPHLPFAPYEDYQFGAAVMKEWVKLARQGKLRGSSEMLAMRFKPVEELYDSENDPHLAKNVAEKPEYQEVLARMRGQLRAWMIETRDLGILDEAEMLARTRETSPWDLGRSLENYERILETADLQLRGESAVPEMMARLQDADAAIRFWACLGLVVTRSSSEKVVAALSAALKDESVSVRITAAEGLFNLGQYEAGLPTLVDALQYEIPHARVRAAGILDSQPPQASSRLEPALEPLREATQNFGPAFGGSFPMERAIQSITGEANHYRWGPGASGAPR